MVQHLRLAALAGLLFMLAYGGVAWTLAGASFPAFYLALPSFSLASPKPAPRVAALPAAPSRIVIAPSREPTPVPDDGYVLRDKLRSAALRASYAYALSPCERMAKENLVAAITAYAKAWHNSMGCGPNGCDYNRLNAAAAAFSTPLDMRVREAVGAAFDKRGVSIDDFPAPLRINVAMLARGRGDPVSACAETSVQVVR